MSTSPEDDRTVLASGSLPARAGEPVHDGQHALPVGTRLAEFEITGVLGEGGFGIVYLALDSSLERQVALKEYMPSFAARTTQAHVSVRSAQNAESFEAGRRSFINEARLLAQFDHPSLVKVYRFWEANGTAYMVMPYYRGATLKETLKSMPRPPDEAWLKALLAPLLDALEVIHQHRCYHRDIAPDNILMLDEGRPLLLDFGAARRAIGDMNQAFTVILKQNYAPIEQYAEMPDMSQGAWTDLYALASVVHFAIDGHAPPPAVSRMISDAYVPLTERLSGRYSHGFLAAIDRALAFRPEDRPQSVAEMRALLDLEALPPRESPPAPSVPPAAPAAAPTFASAAPAPVAEAKDGAAPRGRALLLAAVAALGLGALGWWVYSGTGGRGPAPSAAAPAPAALPAPQPPAPVAAAAPTPATALDAVLAGASPERAVSVQVANPRLRIGRDFIRFSIRSSHAGHVYVYMVGTKGDDFHLLFPNAVDAGNRIGAGQTLELPRKGWRVQAFGPQGTDRFVVMVSDSPRDFGAAGLVRDGDFGAFPMARAAELQRAHGTAPLYAGVPVCTGTPCPAAYGAAAFSVEEVME